MNARTQDWLLAGSIVAVAGWWAYTANRAAKAAAAAVAAYGPPPPQGATPFLNTALPQSTDVTVVPGGNLSIKVDVGTIIIVWLPLGGKWVSFDGAPAPDPVLPDTFLFQGPITHTYIWMDAQNRTQTCVIQFSVGVSTPIVTT
jgi:hypothetical protein